MGGWNSAGRKRYKDLLENIRKAKKSPSTKQVEDFCLLSLQQKRQLKAKPNEENSGRPTQDFETNKACQVDFGEESDVEVAEEEMNFDLVPAEEIYQEYQPPKNKKMRVDGPEKSSEEDGESE